MIRNLQEILSGMAKIGYNDKVSQEVAYIKLQEKYKQKLEENLPVGVWQPDEKPLGWPNLEVLAWDLIQEKGYDTKLLLTWSHVYVAANSFDGIQQVFGAIQASFLQDKFFSVGTEDYKLSYINQLDKMLSSAILALNLNLQSTALEEISLQKFENCNLENLSEFQNLVLEISEVNFEQLKENYGKILEAFNELKSSIEAVCGYNLNKVAKVLDQLNGFLEFWEKVHQQADEQVIDNRKIPGADKSVFFYRNEAFSRVEEGVEILERVDPQNMMIPLLRKALKWKDATLVNIFDDIGGADEVKALISLLKEKS